MTKREKKKAQSVSLSTDDLEKQYGTLEDLRKSQFDNRAKRELKINHTPISKEYAKRVFGKVEKKKKTLQEDIMSFRKFSERRTLRKSVEFPFQYEHARQVLWSQYKYLVEKQSPYHDQPKFDGNMKSVFENTLKWIIGDHKGQYSVSKGLMIFGDKGVGKSLFVETLRDLSAWYQISKGVKDFKFDYLSMDIAGFKISTGEGLDCLKPINGGDLIIDEIREEHLLFKSYGNDFKILNQIFAVRYHLWKNKGAKTITTQNISPSDLHRKFTDPSSETFDPPLWDRIQEQYEFVEMKSSDKRKK